MEREVLISLFPKTDHEKLLFAERYIHELKESLRLERIEKGKLRSEIDELRATLHQSTATEHKADNRQARRDTRKEELYQMQRKHIEGLRNEVKQLRDLRDTLLSRLNTDSK